MIYRFKMFLLSAVFVSTAIADGSKWIVNDPDTLKSDEAGQWGDWHPKMVCPEDKRIALGMRLKFEPYQGTNGDDSAANGVQICCQKDLSSTPGQCTWIGSQQEWGDWQPPVFCPENTKIIGFSQRIECSQGTHQDDTALNGVRMKCNDGTIKLVYAGMWGDWYDWVECPADWYVTGISSKIEKPQGSAKWDDDTAMNQLSLMCQSPTVDRIVGYWVEVAGSNDGVDYQMACSVSLQYTDSASTTETSSISVSEQADFEFKGIGGGVSSTQSSTHSATSSVSNALSHGWSSSVTVNCDITTDERENIWQWQMITGYETSQNGYFGPKMLSPQFSCNKQSLPPLCDPYSCWDNPCRNGTDCQEEDEAMQHLEMVRKPSSAWTSDCCSLDTWTEACYSDKSAMNSFRPCKNMNCYAKCGSRGQTKHMPQCWLCCVGHSIEQDDIWRCKGKEAASKSELR